MDKFHIKLLAGLLIISMLGTVKPIVFNGGSHIAKYISSQNQREMVSEDKVEDYFEAVVYGEGEVKADGIEVLDEEQRTDEAGKIFLIDRWAAAILMFVSILFVTPLLFKSYYFNCHA